MPSPFLLPFHDVAPSFGGPVRVTGADAAVLGRATLGADAVLGGNSVVRADGEVVRIGTRLFLGPRATVHIVHELLPCLIGNNVTVGANAIVHACTVGDDCVIEDDVTVLDDAKLAPGLLLEPCSTVFPRKALEGGWIYAGSPAKPVRELAPGELAARAAAIRSRTVAQSREDATPRSAGLDADQSCFVAQTAQVAGTLVMAPGSSLFFSCVADAGTGTIRIGANTNVQDNTVIRIGSGEVAVGANVTVGHNVRIGQARIGDGTLIGMGAHLVDGVVVEDDVLLAAGSTTEEGQVLGSGWLWGGRPAKPMAKLDEARRDGMRENVRQYCDYAQTFRRLQEQAGFSRS